MGRHDGAEAAYKVVVKVNDQPDQTFPNLSEQNLASTLDTLSKSHQLAGPKKGNQNFQSRVEPASWLAKHGFMLLLIAAAVFLIGFGVLAYCLFCKKKSGDESE